MRRDVRTIKTITPTAIAVNTMVIDVPKLNAAPGFRDMVRVRNPPRSRIGARCDSVATTIAFEAMSRARTPAAAPSRMPIRGGADVGLIIPGITDRVTEPGGDVRLSPLDVRAQPCSLRGQVVPHLGQLGFGPPPLSRPHRKRC